MGLFRLIGLAITLIAVLVACPEPAKPPTVNVPKINSFTATPNALTKAGTVTLEWVVTDASSLSISPNVGVVTGSSKTVSITISTTFELTAQNAGGTDKKTVSVTVPAQNLEEFFTPDKTWTKPIPSNAETIGPEEFKRQVETGELRIATTTSRAAAVQAQQLEYQNDLSYLQNLTPPSGVVTELLARVAASANIRAEPLVMQDGSSVVLLSLAAEVSQLAQATRKSQDSNEQLLRYTNLYNLLGADYKTDLITPEGLAGQSLAAINTARQLLETRLSEIPNLDGDTKLEVSTRSTRIAPSPGASPYPLQDNIRCTPSATGLYQNFFWSLKNFITPVRNQGTRGLCWAFTAVAALESKILVQTGTKINLSEQFLANKVKHDWDEEDYEDGYFAESALQDMLENNQPLPSESYWIYNNSFARAQAGKDGEDNYVGSCDGTELYPKYNGSCSPTAHQSALKCSTFNGAFCGYQVMTFTGVGGIASNPTETLWAGDASKFPLNELRLRLAGGQVIMASFGVRVGFQETKSGFVTDFSNQYRKDDGINLGSGSAGGHAVTIVGFVDASSVRAAAATPQGSLPSVVVPDGIPNDIAGYFIVKNSWKCAGDGGFYYIPDTYLKRYFYRLSVLDFGGRGAAWEAQKNPYLETLGSNASLDTDLRTLTSLFRVAPAAGQTLNALSVQISSNNPNDSFSNSEFFGVRTYNTRFLTPGTRVIQVQVGSENQLKRSSLSVNVINTAPYAKFTFSKPYVYGSNSPATVFDISILDKNETNPQALCSTVRWEVDLPNLIESDTITNTVTGGCRQKIRFASTEYQYVRVFMTDSDGLSNESLATILVENPPINPYPIITDGGVKNWDIAASFGQCSSPISRPQGSTIDLSVLPKATTGCNGLANPRTLQGFVTLQNPDNEALEYLWNLTLSTPNGVYPNPSNPVPLMQSRALDFPIPTVSYGLGGTYQCQVTVKVTPVNDASRVKIQQVWSGQCQVAAVVPN
jgi:C1A family cysteine protease